MDNNTNLENLENARIAHEVASTKLRFHFLALVIDALRAKDYERVKVLIQTCPDLSTVIWIDDALVLAEQGTLNIGGGPVADDIVREYVSSETVLKEARFSIKKNIVKNISSSLDTVFGK